MEFSAWGVIPVFAVLLIPIIVLGQHSRKVKELILLILFTVNTVSYVHAFNEARAWLNEVCDTNVTCHVWGILIPLAFPVVLTLAKIFDIITQKEWREYVYDLPF